MPNNEAINICYSWYFVAYYVTVHNRPVSDEAKRGEGDTVCVGECYWGFQTLTLSNTKTIHFDTLYMRPVSDEVERGGRGGGELETVCVGAGVLLRLSNPDPA